MGVVLSRITSTSRPQNLQYEPSQLLLKFSSNPGQFMAHVDRTFEDSVAAVHEYLGNGANQLLQKRVRLITVWRPFDTPVYSDPLAVADWRTISVENDLLPFIMISNTRKDNIFVARYNKSHAWYFLREQVRVVIWIPV